MWLIWFLPPPSQLYHQVGGKKAKKPQTLKLGSEKALVIPDLQEVSLTPGIGTHTGTVLSSTCWSSPVSPQCVCVCVGGHCWTASDSGQQRAMCALSVYPYVHTYTPDTHFSISFLYLKKARADGEQERERFASVVCCSFHSSLSHSSARGFWVFIFCSECQFIDELQLLAPCACVCYKMLATW